MHSVVIQTVSEHREIEWSCVLVALGTKLSSILVETHGEL